MEINTSLTTLSKFKNGQLTKCTDAIIKAYKAGNKSVEEIAKQLRKIKEDEKWKDDYPTFRDYCDQLGITDKYAYRIIDGLSFKEFDERLQEYTLSQCIELKRSNNIDSLLENDIVLPNMSCKRIREIVDAQLQATLDNKEQDDETTETETETESDDTDDTQLEEKVINVESTPVNMTLVFDNGDHFFYTEDKALLAEIYALIKERGLK